jgi:hypothetical protein
MLLVGLVAAGCGGGSSDPPPLSEAAFLKQGNEVCKRADAAAEKEGKTNAEGISGSQEEELADYASNLLAPWVEEMTSELGDLGAPRAKAKKTEEMIASYESTLEKLESEPELVLSKDPFAAGNKMAAELGLTECQI